MLIRTLFLILLCIVIAPVSIAQNNDLLPEKLLFSYPVLFMKNSENSYIGFKHKTVYSHKMHSDEFIAAKYIKSGLSETIAPKEPSYGDWDFPYSIFDTEEINLAELEQRAGGGTDSIYILDDAGLEAELKAVKKEIDYSEIRSIYFFEEWFFNAQEKRFTKKIRAIMPIRHFYREDDIEKTETLLKKVAMFTFEPVKRRFKKRKLHKRMIHCHSVQYECLLTHTEQIPYEIPFEVTDAPFFTSLSRYHLISGITDQVLANRWMAYSFPENKVLTVPEIEDRMGLIADTIWGVDMYGEEKQFVLMPQLNYNEYQSVIFTEEWYYDPETMRMRKEVTAISPVRHYYNEDDFDYEKPYKKVVFTVYLNN